MVASELVEDVHTLGPLVDVRIILLSSCPWGSECGIAAFFVQFKAACGRDVRVVMVVVAVVKCWLIHCVAVPVRVTPTAAIELIASIPMNRFGLRVDLIVVVHSIVSVVTCAIAVNVLRLVSVCNDTINAAASLTRLQQILGLSDVQLFTFTT